MRFGVASAALLCLELGPAAACWGLGRVASGRLNWSSISQGEIGVKASRRCLRRAVFFDAYASSLVSYRPLAKALDSRQGLADSTLRAKVLTKRSGTS